MHNTLLHMSVTFSKTGQIMHAKKDIPLKALIVDDEWLVREELKKLLAAHPEIEILGEAGSVAQAADLLTRLKADVIFLDIQMPGATGFDLLERVEITSQIIFITAYDQYAIKAFEVNALDYLLKPIQRERLAQSISRLCSRQALSTLTPEKLDYQDVAYVMVAGSLKFIKVALIKCLVAEGNYSYLYYHDRKKELVAKTLQEWENILPGSHFVRIHRSVLVNFEYVEGVEKCRNYTHIVHVQGLEEPFTMSRRYAARLRRVLAW